MRWCQAIRGERRRVNFHHMMARIHHLWRGSFGFPRRLQRFASGHETQEFCEHHHASAVADLNTRQLEFVATLGNLIDRDFATFAAVMPVYAKLSHPISRSAATMISKVSSPWGGGFWLDRLCVIGLAELRWSSSEACPKCVGETMNAGETNGSGDGIDLIT